MASPERHISSPQIHVSSATPEWSTEMVLLKDFSAKRQVPGFAKIVKGTYMTLGSNKFSFQKQHHEMFVHSVKVGVKVLAHCLRRVDTTSVFRRGTHNVFATTRMFAIDQRLAIPISYQGWFELLSEDGKSARPITSVLELWKHRPERCLVRENMKVYLMGDNGKMTFDKTRVLIAGEQIIMSGDITITSPADNKKIKLLRCIDSKGETIFLSFDQAGTFTPIASDDDFAGVFNIRDVVKRFRLPLTVKLVQGVRPKVDPSRFTGIIRLDWVYTDETAFVCPIEKNNVRLLPVPCDAPIQLVSAVNELEMKSTDLYRTLMAKCTRMITNYNNTLHLIVQMPEVTSKGKNRTSNVFSMPFQSETLGPSSARSKSKELRLMEEIDDLYAYVRDGGVPPSKSKFTYDSDEESYWEEPAYEPLDDFRARLQAIESGQRVSYHAKYQPQDPRKVLELDPDIRKMNNGNINGLPKTVPPALSRPPGLSSQPPVPSSTAPTFQDVRNDEEDDDEDKTPTNKTAPPISTVQNNKEGTKVYTMGLASSRSTVELRPNQMAGSTDVVQRSKTFHQSNSDEANTKKKGPFLWSKKAKSQESASNSGSSENSQHNHLARDFKDSDISSLTKGGESSSSSGRGSYNVRKKMQAMYL